MDYLAYLEGLRLYVRLVLVIASLGLIIGGYLMIFYPGGGKPDEQAA